MVTLNRIVLRISSILTLGFKSQISLFSVSENGEEVTGLELSWLSSGTVS